MPPPHGEAAITGTARWIGKRPSIRQLPTAISVERTCGRSVPDRSLLLDEEGNVANVLVFLDDPQLKADEEAAAKPVTVDQRGCAYLPPVVATRAGAAIEFLNSDPLIHNVHAVMALRQGSGQALRQGSGQASLPLFNFAMPLQGMRVQKKLPGSPGTVELRCDVHPWMHAIVRLLNHPYFALTDSQGRYRLSQAPSGTHKLVFWHERLRSRTFMVEIKGGQLLNQNAQWSMEDLSDGVLHR